MAAIQRVSTGILWIAFCAMGPLQADDEPAKDERVASEALLTETMRSFTIHVGEDRANKLVLNEAPVLRYSDPLATGAYAKISEGVVFVWTKEDYPVAITAVHNSNTGRLWCEFLSLSQTPLTGLRQGEVLWSPVTTGVEFQPVKDSPVPDVNASQRLRQMRQIMQSYSATVSDLDKIHQELRLLSKPLARYSKPERGIIDGAVFAFARSTNPEMLVLLEARDVDGKRNWFYSPARFTGRAAELSYKNEPIWSHERVQGQRDSTKPFFQMGLALEPGQ